MSPTKTNGEVKKVVDSNLNEMVEEFTHKASKLCTKINEFMSTGEELLSRAFRESNTIAIGRLAQSIYGEIKSVASSSQLQTLIINEMKTYDEINKLGS